MASPEEENKKLRGALTDLVAWAERMRAAYLSTRTEGIFLQRAREVLTNKEEVCVADTTQNPTPPPWSIDQDGSQLLITADGVGITVANLTGCENAQANAALIIALVNSTKAVK